MQFDLTQKDATASREIGTDIQKHVEPAHLERFHHARAGRQQFEMGRFISPAVTPFVTLAWSSEPARSLL